MVTTARAKWWQNENNRFLWPWFIRDQLENIFEKFYCRERQGHVVGAGYEVGLGDICLHWKNSVFVR